MNNYVSELLRPKFLVLIILSIIPPFVLNSYFTHIAIIILYYALISMGWNIIGGYVGQFSIGHSMFLAIGAYTSTMLFVFANVSPWIGMFIGAFLAVLSSLFVGFLSFRVRGPFYVLISLAFAEVTRVMLVNLAPHGSRGILLPYLGDAPLHFQFFGKEAYYYVILVMLLASIYIVYKIKNSRLGFFFAAIREDEDAALSIGINTLKYKLIATMISAFFCSLGGTFMAQYVLFVNPHHFGLDLSAAMLVCSIIGGVGTIAGPILGAFVWTLLSEIIRGWFGGLTGLHLIIMGILLIVVMIVQPAGIIELIRKAYALFMSKPSKKSGEG